MSTPEVRTTPFIRAVTVSRVSSGPQAKEDRFSLEVQQREMREYCNALGWAVVAEYCEPGTSAYTADLSRLPNLERAVLDVEAGRAERLVYHAAGRLNRKTELGAEIIRRVEAAGGRLVNAQTSMDYSTPEGRAFFGIESVFSEFTSHKISAESQKGKRGQFAKGIQVGQFPWPYRRGETRSSPPIVDPDEAHVLREIFEDFAIGRGVREIARDLTRRGIRPPGPSGRWVPQTIDRMRTNRFYLGEVLHHGQQRKGIHTPLIDEELFAAAQRPRSRSSRTQHPPLLLQGIATCVEGHRLYPHRPWKGPAFPDVRYSYYREPSLDSNKPCSEAGKSFPADPFDAQMSEIIRTLAVDPAWLEYINREARRTPSGTSEARRRSLTAKRKRLVNAFIEGHLDESDYRPKLAEIESELRLLPVEPNELLASLGRLQSFAQLWDNADAQFRHEVCRIIFASATLSSNEPRIVVEPHPEFEPLLDLRRLYVSPTPPARG